MATRRSGIAVVTMVRNEAERYLASALAAWREFADDIIALDDGSTDGTPDLLREAGAHVLHRHAESAAWGHEAPVRAALWNAALRCGAQWLLWADADMVPAADPGDLAARNVDAIAFRLFDLWNWREPALMYRMDGHWQAHAHPRLWMVRCPRETPPGGWQWSPRGLHCGHMPLNYHPARTLVAPTEYSLLHYGYACHLDRESKALQYSSQSSILTPEECAHAQSINDAAVVARLPVHATWRLERSGVSSLEPASAAPSRSGTPTGVASAH